MSSSEPPSGRSTSRSGSLSGSTTQSRPRAVTSEPAEYVSAMSVVCFLEGPDAGGQSAAGVPKQSV